MGANVVDGEGISLSIRGGPRPPNGVQLFWKE